jgi:hypothetical protein
MELQVIIFPNVMGYKFLIYFYNVAKMVIMYKTNCHIWL